MGKRVGTFPRMAVVAAWLPLALGVAACQPDFDPPSLVNKLRVLGVRAEPPEIRIDTASDLHMLTVGLPQDTTLCHAWAFCPFAWAKDGNFRCIDPEVQVPLGTAATASVGFAEVLQALQNAPKVFDKLGMSPPTGVGTTAKPLDTGCFAGGKAPGGGPGALFAADLPEAYVLFQVADVKQFPGGTCPTDPAAMLAQVCVDRDRCLTGYKRLALARMELSCGAFDPATDPPCPKDASQCPQQPVCGCDGKTYFNDCERIAAKVAKRTDGVCTSPNVNPDLAGLDLRWSDGNGNLGPAVDWPADVTPVVPPAVQGEESIFDTAPPVFTDFPLDLTPRWDPAALQVIGPSQDPKKTEPDKESLLFSWFTTGGRFGKERSWDQFPTNSLIPPVLGASETEREVRLWVVVRDGRNGTGWIERRMIVRKDAPTQGNPLCAVRKDLKGCP